MLNEIVFSFSVGLFLHCFVTSPSYGVPHFSAYRDDYKHFNFSPFLHFSHYRKSKHWSEKSMKYSAEWLPLDRDPFPMLAEYYVAASINAISRNCNRINIFILWSLARALEPIKSSRKHRLSDMWIKFTEFSLKIKCVQVTNPFWLIKRWAHTSQQAGEIGRSAGTLCK